MRRIETLFALTWTFKIFELKGNLTDSTVLNIGEAGNINYWVGVDFFVVGSQPEAEPKER